MLKFTLIVAIVAILLVVAPMNAQVSQLFLSAPSELRKVLLLALSVLFDCVWNVWGTAERIYAKFAGKTCLVPRSDEFECQGQRSMVKVTTDKMWFSADISGIAELIYDKFTRKTCLVPRSDEFEGQTGQGQFQRSACGLCLENIFALVLITSICFTLLIARMLIFR